MPRFSQTTHRPLFSYDDLLAPLIDALKRYQTSYLASIMAGIGLGAGVICLLNLFLAAFLPFSPTPIPVAIFMYPILPYWVFFLPILSALPYALSREGEPLEIWWDDLFPALLLGFTLVCLSSLVPLALIAALKTFPLLAQSSILSLGADLFLALPVIYVYGNCFFAEHGFQGYPDYICKLLTFTLTKPLALAMLLFAEPIKHLELAFKDALAGKVEEPNEKPTCSNSRQQMAELGFTFTPDKSYQRSPLPTAQHSQDQHNTGCYLQPLPLSNAEDEKKIEDDFLSKAIIRHL